jgi:hypothetical protein
MYSLLLFLHSLFRWLVLFSLLYAILRAYRGLRSQGDSQSSDGTQAGRPFTKADDALRHWTATIAHIQLMLGCVLYFTSPLIKLYYSPDKAAITRAGATIQAAAMTRAAAQQELSFFGIIHISLMLAAIVVITIGSALAKRRETSQDKFRTMLTWFSIALALILLAIPWPFSPLASRPLFRTF